MVGAGRGGVRGGVVGRELDHRGAGLEGQRLQDLLRQRHLWGDTAGETGGGEESTHLNIRHLHQTQPYVQPMHLLYVMYSQHFLHLLHIQSHHHFAVHTSSRPPLYVQSLYELYIQ